MAGLLIRGRSRRRVEVEVEVEKKREKKREKKTTAASQPCGSISDPSSQPLDLLPAFQLTADRTQEALEQTRFLIKANKDDFNSYPKDLPLECEIELIAATLDAEQEILLKTLKWLHESEQRLEELLTPKPEKLSDPNESNASNNS